MKKWYIKMLMFVLSGVAVAACSDMNDLHDQYLQQGETIYSAKFDSIKIFSGRYRVRVDYWVTDPKVAKCQISWNMGKESKVVDITNTTGETPNSFFIEDLEETTISFDFNTCTADLEYPSLKTNVSATVYGDKYVSTLLNTNVSSYSFSPIEQALTLYWTSNYEGAVAYILKYTDVNDEEREIRAEVNKEKKAVLPDFPEFGSFTYATVYLPAEGAIDEFVIPFSEPFNTAAEGEKPWVLTANMTVPQEAAAWTTWQDADTYMKQFKYDYVEHPEGDNASKNSPGDIGTHIEFVNDATRGKYVYKLTAHAEANDDGSIKCLDDAMKAGNNEERQVNQFSPQTGAGNHDVCGNYGETVIYDWYMKIPADFKPINERCHLFYLIPKEDGGERKGNPVIALNANGDDKDGKNACFQIIHNGNFKANGNNAKLVDKLNMDDFRNEWIHVTVEVLYSYQGTLKVKMERVSDGKVIVNETKTNVELWRENCIDMRAYFGIRRWFKGKIKDNFKGLFPTSGIETVSVYLDDIRIFEKNQNNDSPVAVNP